MPHNYSTACPNGCGAVLTGALQRDADGAAQVHANLCAPHSKNCAACGVTTFHKSAGEANGFVHCRKKR